MQLELLLQQQNIDRSISQVFHHVVGVVGLLDSLKGIFVTYEVP
jgi:hypothetical protein